MPVKRLLLMVLSVSIVIAGFISLSCAARMKAKAAPGNDVSSKEEKKGSNAAKSIVDALDTIQGWDKYVDSGSKLDLASVPGKEGGAIEVTYDMTAGGWVAFNKTMEKDLSGCKAVSFYYKGMGAENTIEIKLEDADGTSFSYVVPSKSNVSSWLTVHVPVYKFEYCWGEDKELNWSKVVRLHFAVAKREGDEGGAGKVIFGRVEAVK
ncbi:MAG: carbohydrate binding domain-containing protein [Elusimicrobiota bacterium]